MAFLYTALADAFAAEGVELHFTLTGDGNMHWASDLALRCGVRTIHARHEHSAVSMAAAYAKANGRVGVASVTMGPGFAQTTAALTTAARAGLPVVLFTGDTPTTARWALQQFDQQPVALAAGARFIRITNAASALANVREAFYTARTERRPVVLAAPIDLQRAPFEPASAYAPAVVPVRPKPTPSPERIAELAGLIDKAGRPIFIAGRGAMDAGEAIAALARRTGALLATTLPARCLFDGDPFALGIAGGFSTDLARQEFARSDLVVAFGAGLGHHTTDGGKLFGHATVVQVDRAPKGYWQGLRGAGIHVAGDAMATARLLLDRTRHKVGARDPDTALRIATHPGDTMEFPPDPGTIDPRTFMAEIDRIVPKDWSVIASTGHSFYFSAALASGRPPQRFHSILDFGAIGANLPYAIGIAAAQGDGKVVLFDGDGSFLMQIQELETVARHRIRLLACVLNDGAYGAELHKLAAEGLDGAETVFGRPALAGVARAFGLRGETISRPGQLASLFEAHQASGQAEVWDVHVSRNVVSPYYRHEHWRHGRPNVPAA